MAKVGGMHSQTNMVLYVIAGIILVGMIFFGVGFKVGNSSVEGFSSEWHGGRQPWKIRDEIQGHLNGTPNDSTCQNVLPALLAEYETKINLGEKHAKTLTNVAEKQKLIYDMFVQRGTLDRLKRRVSAVCK